jgi:hypothetical protein
MTRSLPKYLALLSIIAIALHPQVALAQNSPSSTSVSATVNGGYVEVSVSASYIVYCDTSGNDGGSSASVGDQNQGNYDDGGDDTYFFGPFGPGTYPVSASYSGFYAEACSASPSSASTSATVAGPQASSVAIGETSVLSGREGQFLTIAVAVAGANEYIEGPNPTGPVIIFYGSTVLTSATISPINTSDTNGQAISSGYTFTFSTKGITPGTYSLDAVYSGDSNLTGSSTPVTVTITAPQVSTSTALTLAPTTLTEGASATLTATVTPNVSGITPTGTVTFYSGTDNLGHAALNSSGVASLTLASTGVAPGKYTVTANYGGDAYDYSSVSSGAPVTVQAATKTSLTAKPTTVSPGASVELTATVARSGATGTPTGKVSFELGDYAFGTSTVGSNGVATLSFNTTNLTAGSYAINAVYSGDTLDATSTSTPITVTVQ